jgi:hypothetical protein
MSDQADIATLDWDDLESYGGPRPAWIGQLRRHEGGSADEGGVEPARQATTSDAGKSDAAKTDAVKTELAWAQSYSSQITAGPVPLGLSAPIATELAGYVSDFETKLAAVAINSPTRGSHAIFLKDESRRTLVNFIRETARQIQGTMTVTDAQRDSLGLTIRPTHRTPADPITEMPEVTILEVVGHNVRVRVRDASGVRRGKIPTAQGAVLYSFVGATPPTGAEGWTCEGPITRDSVIIAFPSSLTAGTKIWVAALWYNTRGVGPGCSPVPAQIGVEGSLAESA